MGLVFKLLLGGCWGERVIVGMLSADLDLPRESRFQYEAYYYDDLCRLLMP